MYLLYRFYELYKLSTNNRRGSQVVRQWFAKPLYTSSILVHASKKSRIDFLGVEVSKLLCLRRESKAAVCRSAITRRGRRFLVSEGVPT